MVTMELLPSSEYDIVTERMRQYASARYMELIEAMRPHVAEILTDPAAVHDTEPARINAHVALLKFHTSLIKELGALFRVSDRPVEEREDLIEPAEVERLLQEQRELLELEREDAVAAAAAQVRLELEARERLALGSARDRVVRAVRELQGRGDG